MVVSQGWTDELDVARSHSVAAGAHILGAVLSKVIRGSTLEAVVMSLPSKGVRFFCREEAAMSGRSGTGDGV